LPNSTSRISQIYRDGNVYFDVRLIEKFIPGRTSNFMIQKKFYTYQNYTLVHTDTSVYPLSPTLAPVNAHYNVIDFQSLTHLYPSTNLGFEDINSLLLTIAKPV